MTITPAKPETVQKITLEQWQERAAVWKKATKELVLLWFENDLGTHRQLAAHLGINHSAITRHRKKLIEAGALSGTIDPVKQTRKPGAKVTRPVENSDSKIEEVTIVVDEPAASSNAIEQSSNPTAIERPAEKPKAPNTPNTCLLYTSPSPRDRQKSRMPSSA